MIGIRTNYLYLIANTVPVSPPIIPPTNPPIKKPVKKCLLILYASPKILFFFLSILVNGLFLSISFDSSLGVFIPINPYKT